MTLTDILMIAATAVSPLIAVQVTRFLDERSEDKARKLRIFKTLMATRAYTLSPAHVEALNSIDLEFAGRAEQEKRVRESWQVYLDHLSSTTLEGPQWGDKRLDLLVDLLHSMAQCLGYDFNKTQIKNASYAPVGHGRIESEQANLRSLAIELLDGKRGLPMFLVTNLHNQPVAESTGETRETPPSVN